jgi:hypothetical protein
MFGWVVGIHVPLNPVPLAAVGWVPRLSKMPVFSQFQGLRAWLKTAKIAASGVFTLDRGLAVAENKLDGGPGFAILSRLRVYKS